MNHEHFDERIDFIKSILQLNNLEYEAIEPLEYEETSPFPYNNYIYQIRFLSPTTAARKIYHSKAFTPQPGTVALPADTKTFIIRLANSDPRTGLNNTNRIENEVAFMSLARQALKDSRYRDIVPEVYTWAGVAEGQGFTVQQYMHGSMPDKVFDKLGSSDQAILLEQMAEILVLLQKFEIPQNIAKFGGLKFDVNGALISGQTTIYPFEPSTTYPDFLRSILRAKLTEADFNPVIQGWNKGGVRSRLEQFIDNGIEMFPKSYQEARKSLVHADLTTNNLLFDEKTLRVTALLDYDFSYIATVADEFMLFSFGNIPGGQLPGLFDQGFQSDLRSAMLTDNFDALGAPKNSDIDWDVANAWHKALIQADAARPSTIKNFKEIADIYWLADRISPFELDNPLMRKRMSVEEMNNVRDRTENDIVRFLEVYGQPYNTKEDI